MRKLAAKHFQSRRNRLNVYESEISMEVEKTDIAAVTIIPRFLLIDEDTLGKDGTKPFCDKVEAAIAQGYRPCGSPTAIEGIKGPGHRYLRLLQGMVRFDSPNECSNQAKIADTAVSEELKNAIVQSGDDEIIVPPVESPEIETAPKANKGKGKKNV